MFSEKESNQFRELIKEHKFTQQSYDKLIHKFDLEGVDLESEYTKVVKKQSNLSARQRHVIEDFLTLRDMLRDQTEEDAKPKEEVKAEPEITFPNVEEKTE